MQPETETATVRRDDLDIIVPLCLRYFPDDVAPDVPLALSRLQVARRVGHGTAPAAESERYSAAEPELPDGGYWAEIAFMGRIEYTGYVTEITKNGQPAYRIDLPEKIWGGNPLAYVEHAASGWFSEHPVTGESVRAAWEAEVERRARRAREEAEWRDRQMRALTAGNDDEGDDASDPDDDWAERPENFPVSSPADPF